MDTIKSRRNTQDLGEAKNITEFAAGQSHRTYNIDDQYVLKIYSRKDHFEGTKKLYQHSELKTYAPEIFKILDYDEKLKGPVVVMKYIKGKNLTEHYYKFNDKEKRSLHKDLAKLLKEIHSVNKCARLWNSEWLHQTVKDLAHSVEKKETMKPEHIEKIKDRIKNYIPRSKKVEQNYVHGDFHMENVLVKENGVFSLIDWDVSHVAPKRMEARMLFEQAIIPHALVEEKLEKNYPLGTTKQMIFDLKNEYPEMFPVEFKNELYLLAIERMLYKFDVGDEIVHKERAYAMGQAMYDAVFEEGLVEKLVG